MSTVRQVPLPAEVPSYDSQLPSLHPPVNRNSLDVILIIAITIGFVRETDSVQENTPGFIDICVVVLRGMLERSVTVTVTTSDARSFATGNYLLSRTHSSIIKCITALALLNA